MATAKDTLQALMSAFILTFMLTLSAPLTAGAQPQEVLVTNPSTQPVPVMTGAVEPFQRLRLANFAGNSPVTLNFQSPGGTKMLVVEHLSVSLSTEPSADVGVAVDLEVRQNNALVAVHRIVLTRQDFSGNLAVFLANTPILAFVATNQTLNVKCFVTPVPQTTGGCTATVTGRFVPQP